MTNRIKQWCLLLIAIIMQPMMTKAAPVEIDGIYYNLINKAKEAEENTEYTVTGIEKEAFSNNFNLYSVTIPNTITTIKMWTFNNCKNLTSISIPKSITIIEDEAFRNCI